MDAVPVPSDLLILLGIGSLLPLVVSLVVKWTAPSWVKNVVNLLLSAITAAVAQGVEALTTNRDWHWREVAIGVLVTWAMSVFAYMKLWRDTPVANGLAAATQHVGFGSPVRPTVITERVSENAS